MADTTQTLYVSSVLGLVRSLTIKYKATADALNKNVPLGYVVDLEKPETWRYYKHLAGQYHELDTPMVVTSLDTLQEIEFTYDNLKEHRATWAGYQIGTKNYFDLIERYSEQNTLIRGILNPVDISKAIKAKDFEILGYDHTLVEPQESSLVPELQKFLNYLKQRWYQERYTVTEELYPAAAMANIATALIGEVFNIRKRKIRTAEVHSYHLWAFLGSNGRLDQYRDYLTYDQALWLYRNVLHLRANAGKNETLDDLVKHILTERNIPLIEYNYRNNLEDVPKNIFPKLEMAKIPKNRLAASPFGIQTTTIDEVLAKQVKVARDNKREYANQLTIIPAKGKASPYSQLPTKVLESEMVDRSDSLPTRFADTLLNEWIYLATHGRYVANVTLTNPFNTELISMTAHEAVTLWVYCIGRMYDIEMLEIPTIQVHNVTRLTPPSFMELRGITSPERVTPDAIHAAINEYTQIGTIISTEGFYQKASRIQANIQAHRFLYATQEEFRTRGQLELMTKRFYQNVNCILSKEGYSFEQFFKVKNWDVMRMSKSQYQSFAADILNVITGSDLRNTTTVKEIQNAMINIVSRMSSYSIQFLKKINASPALVVDFPVIRVSEVEVENKLHAYFQNKIEVLDERTKDKIEVFYDLAKSGIYDANVQSKNSYKLDVSLSYRVSGRIRQNVRYPITKTYVRYDWTPDIGEVVTKTKLDGVWAQPAEDFDIGKYIVEQKLSGLGQFPVDPEPQLSEVVTTRQLVGLEQVLSEPPAETLEELFPGLTLMGFLD